MLHDGFDDMRDEGWILVVEEVETDGDALKKNVGSAVRSFYFFEDCAL